MFKKNYAKEVSFLSNITPYHIYCLGFCSVSKVR